MCVKVRIYLIIIDLLSLLWTLTRILSYNRFYSWNSNASLNQNFTPEAGHFSFFPLFKSYAETTLLIDEDYISK